MNIKFKIFSTPSFDKELKKLLKRDKKIADVLEKITEVLHIDPFNQSKKYGIKKLTDVKQGTGQWRVCVGNYRFRYDIERDKVIIHHIRDRRDSYR